MTVREQLRERNRKLAEQRGVTIETLPTGLLRLRGRRIDLLVRDLADLHPSDLSPTY